MTTELREGTLVFGAPRSGTTLLRRLLNAHPEFACPGETNLFAACGRFLEAEPIASGIDVGVITGLRYAGFSEAEILERLRAFSFGFMQEHARRENKPRWVEKTAFNSFYIESLERLCGSHVRYICIVRHGLDVAVSLRDLCDANDRYLSELHAYVIRYPRPYEAFAHAWADITRSILDFAARRSNDAILVRYEDLVSAPDETMQRICTSLGSEWLPEYAQKALASTDGVGLGDWKTYTKPAVDASSVNRWKTLPAASVARLAPIVNEMLARAGYESVASAPEENQADALRRYELGLMLQAMKSQRPAE